MSQSIIRLQEVKLRKFKNIEHGVAAFASLDETRKARFSSTSDIMGIYGQNGSGKTALVDALDLLSTILKGNSLPEDILDMITCHETETNLEFIFLLESQEKKYLIYYTLIISPYNNKGVITKEELIYSPLIDNKWAPKIKIIDYSIVNQKEIFKPASKFLQVKQKRKENLIALNVAKELAIENQTSFIFNKRSRALWEDGFMDNGQCSLIIESLADFAKYHLFIVKTRQLGLININQRIPFNFLVEDNGEVNALDVAIKLFEPSILKESSYNLVTNIVKQINIVFHSMIPGLKIGVVDYGVTLLKDGSLGVKIELVSIRGDMTIPLKYESDGIKKIISVLSMLIGMYNNSSVCLVIDELDAGVFEFLLGEMLLILKENAKGQLIFTSHNLRPLEVLGKENLIFTTNNEKNRYMRFKTGGTQNLRNLYLRGITLGGQKECIYETTNSFNISHAFRAAGRKCNEN